MSKNKKYIVRLSDDDVQRLRSTLKKKDTNETIANRCRILLDVDENHSPVLTQMQTAKEHGVEVQFLTQLKIFALTDWKVY